MIAILDYGMGNLRSVEKAFEHVGAQTEITYAPERIRAADGLVLPGVGAFPKAMQAIRERRIDELVDERRAAGVPILGICLGMQLLFDRSVELGGADVLERLLDRAQVAHAVVEDGDHRSPFVDGTPDTSGSSEHAWRRARANALNDASTM